MKKPAITIKTVSERAGLGVTTVSDILLRGKTNYRKKTIEKVRRIAEELHFEPNVLAQGIRGGRTKTIGIILTHSLTDPFFAIIVDEIAQHLESLGYVTILSVSDDVEERDRRAIRYFGSRRVDGMLIGPVYPKKGEESVYDRYASELPTVTFLADQNSPFDSVNLSRGAYSTGELAAQHLLDCGHREIGYIMCPPFPNKRKGTQTFRGFYDTLRAAGCYEDKWVWTYDGIGSADKAFALADSVLSKQKKADLPTAFFCHTDSYAEATMAALRSHGYRLPEDFSVVGANDLSSSRFTYPALTSIDKSPGEIARKACELLIEKIGDGERAKQLIEIQPRLVERDSVTQIQTEASSVIPAGAR